ncbi:aryl hydrocarbon receptor 2 [Sardina pilchardus]|uniref:aryl hydrocarbon receptor 2 n=1 Tax=Sardina pilchardus TaxID=27697 RepID=UPI002E0F5552
MLGNAGIYAAKKRKKPVQKIPKPPPPEGVKSNPSKRHRDRLNGELDKLTNLLPFSEDVRARLDKLSVLRLSVGYLKVKSFFKATMKPSIGWPGQGAFGTNGQTTSSLDGVSFSEGDLLLQALNGFVMVVTAEGYVFYSSPTIQDYLGFHQSDVVHQSVFELIHTDDRAMFRRQLHFALNPTQTDCTEASDSMQSSSEVTSNLMTYNPLQLPPENSSFLERSFCCRFRCLLDNSSGFLALNFQGRLKYLHGQNKMAEDGTMSHPQLALFVIATPLQPPSILEIRSKTLIFQTKHKLDFTPMGVDTRGKVVLGYSELELCMRGSGYQFIHAADMMYCADNHLKMMKTGESGLTVFRLLTKGGSWLWVQANARLIYKQGRPEFIVARQRALTNEEGEENLRQRKIQLPFNFATGEAVLYENAAPMGSIPIQPTKEPLKLTTTAEQVNVDPDSMLGSMLKQDQMLYGNGNGNGSSDAAANANANVQFPPMPIDVPVNLPMDQIFLDSHALMTGTAPAMGPVKAEASVKDMVETLQQIIADASLCPELQLDMEVGELELKEWESTLLRMNMTTSESAVQLNSILANDIFSYVEGLFEENGLQMPAAGQAGAFGDVHPDCLPEMELQTSIMAAAGQGFGLQGAPLPQQQQQQQPTFNDAQQQSSLLGMGLQNNVPMGGAPRGTMKLTHMGPEMTLAQSVPAGGLHAQALPQRVLGNGADRQGFAAAAMAGQYNNHQQSQGQLQQGRLGNGPQQNSRVAVPQRRILTGQQEMLGQVHPNAMTVPAMPHHNAMPAAAAAALPSQPMAFQGQKPLGQPNGQDGPWVSSLPGSAMGMPSQADMSLTNSPAACVQGRFSLHTQPGQNSWPPQQQPQPQQNHLSQQNHLQQIQPQQNQNQNHQNHQQQQQLPNALSSGHQHFQQSSCYAQTPDFQRDMSQLLPQSAQAFGTTFRPQNPIAASSASSSSSAPPLPGLMGVAHVPKNSCMFDSSPPAAALAQINPAAPGPSALVNGVGYNHRRPDVSALPGHGMKGLLHHSPPQQQQQQQQQQQAPCFYQRGATDALGTANAAAAAAAMPGLNHMTPQDALNPLANQLVMGISAEALMAQQRQFLCNGQTQITNPLIKDNGPFQFPNMVNETTYFTENNQSNCCDF